MTSIVYYVTVDTYEALHDKKELSPIHSRALVSAFTEHKIRFGYDEKSDLYVVKWGAGYSETLATKPCELGPKIKSHPYMFKVGSVMQIQAREILGELMQTYGTHIKGVTGYSLVNTRYLGTIGLKFEPAIIGLCQRTPERSQKNLRMINLHSRSQEELRQFEAEVNLRLLVDRITGDYLYTK